MCSSISLILKLAWDEAESYLGMLILLSLSLTGCNKIIEVEPPATYLTSENVYADDNMAASVLTGIYISLSKTSPLKVQTINSISIIGAVSSDELSVYGGPGNSNAALVQYYLNSLSAGSRSSPGFNVWYDLYSNIYIVNVAIEKLPTSSALTSSVRRQLLGEAKFLRAFCYFYLVNLYGDVPLATSSDYRINATLPRLPKAKIYQQIIEDLKSAQDLLSDNYVTADAKTPTSERLRPNAGAATALLARCYLYTDEWYDAETQATKLIDNRAVYDTVSLNNVFLKDSKEAIWQLQPVNSGWNTEDARALILPITGPTSNSSISGYPLYLSSEFLNSFEQNDKRKSNWVSSVTVGNASGATTYYYPAKYKSATLNAPVTEYTVALRLAEQYLIRAESRVRLNKLKDALDDLNAIRKRAGLLPETANDQVSLLNMIQHERRMELFTEWADRWLDLKRTGKVDNVMSKVASTKGGTWSTNWALFPIPLYDINQNPNLTQNFGY